MQGETRGRVQVQKWSYQLVAKAMSGGDTGAWGW